MNGKVKRFPLRDILSVTTGRLLTKGNGPSDNGIGALYDLLGHMTGGSPFTHQLPRFAEECKPWLYRWFPELAAAESGSAMKSLDLWVSKAPSCPDEGVKMWLAELKMMNPDLQDEYDVGQIQADDHDTRDPLDELVAMRGSDEGIFPVLVSPNEPSTSVLN
jgi:hypothetical protein